MKVQREGDRKDKAQLREREEGNDIKCWHMTAQRRGRAQCIKVGPPAD